jgi:DNA mismatch repair protein MSH2
LKQVATETGLEAGKTIKLEYSGHQGHHLRVTMKEEKNLRGNKSYIILDNNKSGVKFRNSKMEALNDEHNDLTKRYELQQESIVQEIIGISAGYADPMNHLGQVISRLDVLVALAVTAVSAPTPYCRPVVEPAGSGQMTFTQLRHPIIEIQDNVNFIPNDVFFSKDSSYFQIITGPNMGGKSTYIRSVGVAVIMAQVGSFVPADAATIQVVDSVMVRIGASDCQVKGISTFMAEMLETSSILATATSNSLVLVDELGRGTSTYDGFGLAWAVSEHIATVTKCFTLFTTHYTELTSLADKVPGVKNYHVSAITDHEKLTLLYEVQPGVCDKSFGLHVARLASFPESVVKEANDRVALLEDSVKMENMKDEEKRRTIEEGETILETFFDSVKKLDGVTNDSELVEKFNKLKQDALNSNNAYIQSLATAGTC